MFTDAKHRADFRCPACVKGPMDVFYRVHGVPVHSVLLMRSREQAQSYPKGDIALGFCLICGFIANTAFDPSVHEYSRDYEETQGCSDTFQSFSSDLAGLLVNRYDLRDRKIVEIGCGKGEFLALLCELGGSSGIGFDPAYVPGRESRGRARDITFVNDFYSEKYAELEADFYCCKMTLEHISRPLEFVSMLRGAIGKRTDPVLFFQVPDAERILAGGAFWDIYYEHCSYFTEASLARLFLRAGFEVLDLRKGFGGQYLLIEARPSDERVAVEEGGDFASLVYRFAERARAKIAEWRRRIDELAASGGIVIWGAGSKGVAFLTTLGIEVDQIEFAVDINPHKQGSFLPGTGQQIVAPEFLGDYRPRTVIVMNPIYQREIEATLAALRVQCQIVSVEV